MYNNVYVYIIISDYIYTPDLLGDDTSGARHTGVTFGRHLGILLNIPLRRPPCTVQHSRWPEQSCKERRMFALNWQSRAQERRDF